jgi:hypothetical protein
VFPDGLRMQVKALRVHKARTNTSSLAIIELRLGTIEKAGSPARVLLSMLEGFYAYPEARLTYECLEFDIRSYPDLDGHRKQLARLMGRIGQ